MLRIHATASGREQSRRPGEIVAEVEALAREGVREITLLGQNVNSWGRDLLPDIRTEFGELLRACDAVEGIERIRFTSPHPKDFREPVIAAIAECVSVCEHVHLPMQSGSTQVLKRMLRRYTREGYMECVARLRSAIPELALDLEDALAGALDDLLLACRDDHVVDADRDAGAGRVVEARVHELVREDDRLLERQDGEDERRGRVGRGLGLAHPRLRTTIVTCSVRARRVASGSSIVSIPAS